MAAFSLLAPTLASSKTLTLSCPSPALLFPSNLAAAASHRQLTFAPFADFPAALRKSRGLELSFVTRVAAVSSDFEQELTEEEGEEVSGDEASFSPDLKLFVGNLPFTVDSAELAGLFSNAGNVEMVEVVYDKLTGNSRGFGFVTMSSVEEVEAAAQQFNGYEFKGRTLRVNSGPPPPREDRPPRARRTGGGGFGGGGFSGGSQDSSNRLFIGNLSWGVDNAALQTLFSEQGRVTDAKVVYDRESGRSRGFGFVTYNTAEEANNAISSLDGSDLDGRTIRVSVADARPPRREF